MKNMTPEQEARYALDFGVARSDLPEDAQLAYDRPSSKATLPRLAVVPGKCPEVSQPAYQRRSET
jgi:hypothetical protein